jgi:uncharacterized protein
VDFEWDPGKEASNRLKHGIGFRAARLVLDDPACIEWDVSREADKEWRFKAVGQIDGRLYALVFTRRGGLVRVISLRRTNSAEERLYDNRPEQDRP